MANNRLEFPASLSIADILAEGWNLVSGLKGPVCVVAIFGMIAMILLSIVLVVGAFLGIASIFFNHHGLSPLGFILSGLLGLIFVIVYGFFHVANIMLGVRQAIGLQATASKAFTECMGALPPLIGLMVVYGVFAIVINIILGADLSRLNGFLSFIVKLAVYCALLLANYVLVFGTPLVIAKRQSFSEALSSSLQGIAYYWWQLILVTIIMAIILGISAIPLGIGLIWTLPMWYAVQGVLFREIFQLKQATTRQPQATGMPGQPKNVG